MRSSEIEKTARATFSSRYPEDKILAKYDRDADVLYVNFLTSEPQKADFGRRFGDYIVRIKKGLVIGVTIINAMLHYDTRFNDCPPILWHKSIIT